MSEISPEAVKTIESLKPLVPPTPRPRRKIKRKKAKIVKVERKRPYVPFYKPSSKNFVPKPDPNAEVQEESVDVESDEGVVGEEKPNTPIEAPKVSISNITEYEFEAIKQIARSKLGAFSTFTDKNYRTFDHHLLIQECLMSVARGEIKRLIINIPPRHGKSELVSVKFPAWYLGLHPDRFVMCTSYSAELSDTFSRRARNLVDSQEYKILFDTRLAKDSKAVSSWNTSAGGGYISAGVGGPITGKGFHIGIIDDPIPNKESASSENQRNKIWEWYISTFLTRQMTNSAIIITQTRWHEDDLTGRLITKEEHGGEEWHKLILPALDDDDNALWEESYPSSYLKQMRQTMGELEFSCLYQQNPMAEDGNIFKKQWFQYYTDNDIALLRLKKYIFIDPAISEKRTADQTAIICIGIDIDSNNIYVLEDFHDRCLPDVFIEKLFSMVVKHKPEKVAVETIAYQKILPIEIKKQMKMRNIYFVLEEVSPRGEKTSRIKMTLHPRFYNRFVYTKASDIDLEGQLLKFPNGKHDDIIDALAGAIDLADVSNFGQKNGRMVIQDFGLDSMLSQTNGTSNKITSAVVQDFGLDNL